jgi:hypothetical protein
MSKQLKLTFSGFPDEVVLTLLESEEPTCSKLLWEEVEEPLKLWLSHTTSTGDYILARGRPERDPRPTGTQASPLSGKTKHLSNLGQGAVVYAGNKFLAFNYGPDNTEPVAAPGPIVARGENLDTFYRAGRYVWEQHKKAKLVIATVSRKEG